MKRTYVITALLVLILLVTLVPAAFAASLGDITDNVLRIGNDFYSMDSLNFDDQHLIDSITAGGSFGYFKINGLWYNILSLSDAQIGDPAYAEPASAVQEWDLIGTWFKSGTEEEQVTTDSGPSGTYAIEDKNQFSKIFNVTLNGLDEAQYFNVYKDQTALSETPKPLSEGIVNISAMFSDLSLLRVYFYSDAAGSNLLGTATVLPNGTLNITVEDTPGDFEVIDIY